MRKRLIGWLTGAYSFAIYHSCGWDCARGFWTQQGWDWLANRLADLLVWLDPGIAEYYGGKA